MAFSPTEIQRILRSARRLTLDAPINTVETFVSTALQLNAAQVIDYFPGPGNPKDLLADAVSYLTGERDELLREKGHVPQFAVFEDALGAFKIAGLSTYLETKDFTASEVVLRARLTHHKRIAKALRTLEQGQNLEALAAAIMNSSCAYGEATKGSGDQGIDAIGWRDLMLVESAFTNELIRSTDVLPGEKVFLFVSSKAAIGATAGALSSLDPAAIRELVGGWVIQRTAEGMWQRSAGIRMLSPVQMILVTTHRLSVAAKALCFDLGIQLWGSPELVYLICKWAPDAVFDDGAGYRFSGHAFRKWWGKRDRKRLTAKA